MAESSLMASSYVAGAAALVLDADPTKAAPEVLSEILSTAIVNCTANLRAGDPNALLYVGADDPPHCWCPDSCRVLNLPYFDGCRMEFCSLQCDFCAERQQLK